MAEYWTDPDGVEFALVEDCMTEDIVLVKVELLDRLNAKVVMKC